MLSREGKQTDRGAVGAEFIGYNRRRREALLLQEFPHQPNCRPSVPAGLNQEIQDFALTVHGTPEIELPPSNYDDHLVQVPAFGRSWPPTLNPPRIGPTEFQDPSSNCLIRDVETTLGKQVLNVPIAQRETAIEPDGMLDDDRWKAVTTVGYLAHPEKLKHRPCRSHAVNVTMPNIFIERLWRSLKYQEVYLHELTDGFAAERVIGEWIDFYNTERPHSSLGGQPPAEAYGAGQPVEMMDKPDSLPTSPQAQQQQQDVINTILAA